MNLRLSIRAMASCGVSDCLLPPNKATMPFGLGYLASMRKAGKVSNHPEDNDNPSKTGEL